MNRVVISGSGLFTAPHTISNEELVASYNTYVQQFNAKNAERIAAGEIARLEESSVDFIEKASGIKQRSVMNKEGILDTQRMRPNFKPRANNELSLQAEMAVDAAQQALAASGKSPADIDMVICAASIMQRPYPAMAIEVQNALGIAQGAAFDMNVACSSATFALEMAANAVRCGTARAVLIVNPEICSAQLAWKDRDCHFIFGDVATALVVENAETASSKDQWEILGTKLVTSFTNNIRTNAGFLSHCEDRDPYERDQLFVQEGRKVFKEVVPMVANMIVEQMETLGLEGRDMRRLWLHQANTNMNRLIAHRVLGHEASEDESPTVLDTYGNTSSAGSIIAFHLNHEDMVAGDTGLICSFGAGYSAGTVFVRKT